VIDTISAQYYTLRMAMGKRKPMRQPALWVTTTDLPTAASHPFYRRLNQLLREQGFDDFAEAFPPGSTPTRWAVPACRRGFTSGCC
jgi:hypothetical protein